MGVGMAPLPPQRERGWGANADNEGLSGEGTFGIEVCHPPRATRTPAPPAGTGCRPLLLVPQVSDHVAAVRHALAVPVQLVAFADPFHGERTRVAGIKHRGDGEAVVHIAVG